MSPDDWTYLILLVLCVPFGGVVKKCKLSKHRQIAALCAGLSIVIYASGWHTFHSVVTVLVNLLIIKVSKRHCHIFSFIWCFSYLMFFRTVHYFGLPEVPSYCNAVQLLLTLKLVGLAFEVHDSDSIERQLVVKAGDPQLQLKREFECISPSVFDILAYSYCYIGILTGPYYKFRTYWDMINQQNADSIPAKSFLVDKLKVLPFFMMGFYFVSNHYSSEYILTDEFYNNHSSLYHLWYSVPLFFQFRMRIYSAWVLAECMCITAGLGAYPAHCKPKTGGGPSSLQSLKECQNKDPAEIEYDFETIHNIEPYSCEFVPTFRGGMRNWNMSVQWWLASFVYKRVPRSIGVTVTMVVSAFWHGIHPGYYLSFLTVPLYLMAERQMSQRFRDIASPRNQHIYDFWSWVFRMRAFEYISVGFLVLTFKGTMNYWNSVYFYMHGVIVFFLAVVLICKPRRQDKRKTNLACNK